MELSNIPITGSSLNLSVERTVSASATKEHMEFSSKAAPRITKDVSTITSIEELKQADLRGDHYTISDEQLIKAIDRAIQAMQGKTTDLEFSVHEKTKMIAVKVVDRESREVIKEIPPEKTLDFVAKLWEMAGILVDERR